MVPSRRVSRAARHVTHDRPARLTTMVFCLGNNKERSAASPKVPWM